MVTITTRIVHTHDTEENWNKCTSFIPNQGEMIIYDADDNYNYPRVKIGDGKTIVTDLPFTIGMTLETLLNTKDGIHYLDGGRIASRNNMG